LCLNSAIELREFIELRQTNNRWLDHKTGRLSSHPMVIYLSFKKLWIYIYYIIVSQTTEIIKNFDVEIFIKYISMERKICEMIGLVIQSLNWLKPKRE